uniref:fructose-bisphosphate aldolase n=1 Tax=Ostreococcus mediterraneus TaxID=1486918 RepID=A0A7S0WG14_9CHLO|mmetsp:Transcript_5026/g.10961  ORF Transcript_5026/g.10961 Transcript_5026/m.10961 type:complete len:381 (+) Transcript_5026:236-1378(+)
MLATASTTYAGAKVAAKTTTVTKRANVITRAGQYDDELLQTAQNMTKPGKGILAMDESNATCGSRLEGVGVENTEENRRRYRELLITTPNLGEYIGGAILFEETLYQSCADGTSFVDALKKQGVYPGIKVDKGLRPLANSNGESWCQGLDGLAERAAEYYKQGARFCKWRSVVSIPAGPSKIAVTDCAYGLARYAAICQNAGLVPIVEPEILLDGDHDIDRNFEVASMVWAETFKYLADNNVKFDRMLLKPSMVAPGADCTKKSNAKEVAEYTLKMLNSRVPPETAGIMFLSGGLSELDSTMYLNAMNQSPNPWHVSFSYARALQNSVIKEWSGSDERIASAQEILKRRTVENGQAQLGKFDVTKSQTDGASVYEKGYVY